MQPTMAWDASCWDLTLRLRAEHRPEEPIDETCALFARAITAALRSSDDGVRASKPPPYPKSPDTLVPNYREFKKHLQVHAAAGAAQGPSDQPRSAGAEKLGYLVGRVTRRRCFFTTRQGRLGIGPSGTALGDRLRVVFYCPTPYLFWPYGSESFELVGEVYVDHFMHGEALRMLDQKEADEIRWTVS